MAARLRVALLLALVPLAALPSPVAAWEENWWDGVNNWTHESGPAPIIDPHAGIGGEPALKIPRETGTMVLSRPVGYGMGTDPNDPNVGAVLRTMFRFWGHNGFTGFRVTIEYTGSDLAHREAWMELSPWSSNNVAFGVHPWSSYSLGSVQGGTWYELDIRFMRHEPKVKFGVQEYEGGPWLATYELTIPSVPGLIDRVRIDGTSLEGGSRDVYIDKLWFPNLIPAQPPGPVENAQVRWIPDVCPILAEPACDMVEPGRSPRENGHGPSDLEVTWDAPKHNGTSPIAAYEIRRSWGESVFRTWTVDGSSRSLIEYDVPAGPWEFSVRAISAAGAGPEQSARGLSTGVHALPNPQPSPSQFTQWADSARLHFGFAGASASLTSPDGRTMTLTSLHYEPEAMVAVVSFSGHIFSIEDESGNPLHPSVLQVSCPVRLDGRRCLDAVAADGTWQITPAANDAGRPAGSFVTIGGWSWDDWATSSGSESRFSGGNWRTWNLHEQTTAVYAACAFACQIQGPPEQSLEYARTFV